MRIVLSEGSERILPSILLGSLMSLTSASVFRLILNAAPNPQDMALTIVTAPYATARPIRSKHLLLDVG